MYRSAPFLLMCFPISAYAATPAAPTTVVVTGQRAEVSQRIDRKIYRTGQDTQSAAGSAADVLNDIPSVDVDADGNVSLRGDAHVTVLIDGKPSAQVSGAAAADGLTQIPASAIDRVEVVTNPSAQFKAEGSGGVINIILKKTHKPGLSTSAQANLGNDGRANLNTSATLTRGKFSLTGGGGLRQDKRVRDISDVRTNLDPVTGLPVSSSQDLLENAYRLMQSLNAGAGYDLTDRDHLSANIGWGERHGDRYFLQQDDALAADGSETPSSDRSSSGKEWRLDLSQSLSYDHHFARDGETLSVNLQRTIARERENYTYTNSYFSPSGPDTHDTLHLGLDLVDTDVSADYVLPLSGHRTLKLGYDFQRDDNGFDNSGTLLNPASGQYEVNPQVTNDFRYYQAIQAAYASYQTKAGPIDVLAGLRLEDTHVRTHQITGGQTSRNAYLRAYPSLHLNYPLSEAGKLFASYAGRVSRPDPEQLNPFTDYQDTHNLRAGNPGLRPEETQSLEAGYSYDTKALSYSATAYWRTIRNAVTDITEVVSDGVVLSTKANIPHSRSGGLEWTASGRIVPKLGYNLSGNVFYNEIDTRAFGGLGTRANVAANAKASLDYKPSTADTWQVSGNYTGKRLTPQGYLLPVFTVNMGYRHQIRDNLSLVMTLSDAFNGQKYQRIVDTAALHDHYARQFAGRIVYVGVSYTGTMAKKPKAASFDYDQ